MKNLEPPSRFLPSRKSPPSASKPGVTCLPGCSAGSATASRAWPTVLRFHSHRRFGRPIAPFNFTEDPGQSAVIRIKIIYRIFMTGLDGTPMPSFADNIKPDEAWDLVFYLRTLCVSTARRRIWQKGLGLKPVDPERSSTRGVGSTVRATMASNGKFCSSQGERKSMRIDYNLRCCTIDRSFG